MLIWQWPCWFLIQVSFIYWLFYGILGTQESSKNRAIVAPATQTENQTSCKCNCYEPETEGTETEDTQKDEVGDTDSEWETSFNMSQTESTISDESTPVKSLLWVNSKIFCLMWTLFIHCVHACSYICNCN